MDRARLAFETIAGELEAEKARLEDALADARGEIQALHSAMVEAAEVHAARERALLEANAALLGRIDELAATVAHLQTQALQHARDVNAALVVGTPRPATVPRSVVDALHGGNRSTLRAFTNPQPTPVSTNGTHGHSEGDNPPTDAAVAAVLRSTDAYAATLRTAAARDLQAYTARLAASVNRHNVGGDGDGDGKGNATLDGFGIEDDSASRPGDAKSLTSALVPHLSGASTDRPLMTINTTMPSSPFSGVQPASIPRLRTDSSSRPGAIYSSVMHTGSTSSGATSNTAALPSTTPARPEYRARPYEHEPTASAPVAPHPILTTSAVDRQTAAQVPALTASGIAAKAMNPATVAVQQPVRATTAAAAPRYVGGGNEKPPSSQSPAGGGAVPGTGAPGTAVLSPAEFIAALRVEFPPATVSRLLSALAMFRDGALAKSELLHTARGLLTSTPVAPSSVSGSRPSTNGVAADGRRRVELLAAFTKLMGSE